MKIGESVNKDMRTRYITNYNSSNDPDKRTFHLEFESNKLSWKISVLENGLIVKDLLGEGIFFPLFFCYRREINRL